MSGSKFEIKISKEANGDDVDLNNMSLAASKALVEILDAVNKMAQSEQDPNQISIKIRQGSAIVEIDAPDAIMASMHENVSATLDRRTSNDAYLKSLESIRKVIHANGLTYESNIVFNNERIELIADLKNRKQIRKRRVKKTVREFDIEFIEGRLIENGGKNPNIHVEIDGNKQKVTCTELQARRVNAYLYQPIKISAWVKIDQNSNKEYTFCDNYIHDELFKEFGEEINSILNEEGTVPLKRIHRKFRELFTNNRFDDARKFLRIFSNPIVDIHWQRTTLVATKAFKEDTKYADLIDLIIDNLKKKTGKDII